MINLMALSNMSNGVILNTGNKSEAMMGYCTVYGDSAGVFSPIGCLYKTEVYELARFRNSAGGSVIPNNCFTKPPSAELAPGQEDEKSFGYSYAQIDRVLFESFELQKKPSEFSVEGLSETDIVAIINRVKANKFKAIYLPPNPLS